MNNDFLHFYVFETELKHFCRFLGKKIGRLEKKEVMQDSKLASRYPSLPPQEQNHQSHQRSLTESMSRPAHFLKSLSAKQLVPTEPERNIKANRYR
jgi:hypothetical protein